MSSLKNMMKSPAAHHRTPSELFHAPEVETSQRGNRTSRPPTSAADVLNDHFKAFETVPADLHEPARPRTSHAPSVKPPVLHRAVNSISRRSIGSQSVTALPSFPTAADELDNPFAEACPAPFTMSREPTNREPNRKKSFQSLRKRSESIGQAIKFAAMKARPSSTQHDVPMPPPPRRMPEPQAVSNQKSGPRQSTDLRTTSTTMSTPKSPAPSLKSRKPPPSSYSAFPPSPMIGHDSRGTVGLGLRVK